MRYHISKDLWQYSGCCGMYFFQVNSTEFPENWIKINLITQKDVVLSVESRYNEYINADADIRERRCIVCMPYIHILLEKGGCRWGRRKRKIMTVCLRQ
jgi:hypothetical protein